jgi:uncharacterized membrane protein
MLAPIAVLYLVLLLTVVGVGKDWLNAPPSALAFVSFSLASAAAPFLTFYGLVRRRRWIYLVSAIWFLLLTVYFGFFSYILLPRSNGPPNVSVMLLLAVIPFILSAALSYLQARLYIEARRETA